MRCLNPCCDGCSAGCRTSGVNTPIKKSVLILVVMDAVLDDGKPSPLDLKSTVLILVVMDAVLDEMKLKKKPKPGLSLNPCCDGCSAGCLVLRLC